MIEFQNLSIWLIPLLALAGIAATYIWSEKKRDKTLKSLVGDQMFPKLLSTACNQRRHWRSILFVIAWILIGFCLLRPFSGREFEVRQQSSRDILVLLDISNSMNVIDSFGESRLEYCKKTLLKMSQERITDRFGLITFAGIPYLEIPLTSDTYSFDQAVQETNSANIPVGGTNIEYALKKAVSEFKEGAAHKALLLFSDGEEISGTTTEVVKVLKDKNIKVITVLAGDERKEGTVRDSYGRAKKKNNKLLTSKADAIVLKKLAEDTGGTFIPFNPESHNRDQLIKILKEIDNMTASEGENDTVEKPREIFQPFLLAALVLLMVRMFLGERKKLAAHAAILALCFCIPLRAQNTVPNNELQKFYSEQELQQMSQLSDEQVKRLLKLKGDEAILRMKANDSNSDEDSKCLSYYNLGVNLMEQHQLCPIEAQPATEQNTIPVESSFSKVEEAFASSLAHVGDNIKVKASTAHNQGALYHNEARRIYLNDPEAAISMLDKASEFYRESLITNLGDQQSRKNLELSYIHKKEAEIVKEIKELHEQAKEKTGNALFGIRDWPKSADKSNKLNEINSNISEASKAVQGAATKATQIENKQMIELYQKVENYLNSATSELESMKEENNRKKAETDTANAYTLLGGNPEKPPENSQSDNSNDKGEPGDNKDDGKENDPNQKPDNNSKDNKSDQENKDNQPKDNKDKDNNSQNPSDKGKEGDNKQEQDKKLDPDNQKGEFNKEENLQKSQMTKEEEKKVATRREAEALLRKLQNKEKEVRQKLRQHEIDQIKREMFRQGIYVPPEADK